MELAPLQRTVALSNGNPIKGGTDRPRSLGPGQGPHPTGDSAGARHLGVQGSLAQPGESEWVETVSQRETEVQAAGQPVTSCRTPVPGATWGATSASAPDPSLTQGAAEQRPLRWVEQRAARAPSTTVGTGGPFTNHTHDQKPSLHCSVSAFNIVSQKEWSQGCGFHGNCHGYRAERKGLTETATPPTAPRRRLPRVMLHPHTPSGDTIPERWGGAAW